ncbi:MAG: hypothetical protein ABH874_06720 [Methanobacteriota archaeon]|jgi:transposase-like protein
MNATEEVSQRKNNEGLICPKCKSEEIEVISLSEKRCESCSYVGFTTEFMGF